jgi:hypothetical protein
MDDLQQINKVQQLLIDTESISKTLKIMYYDKKLNEIEKFKSIEEADIKFKKCRKLLQMNLSKLKDMLDINFNLFLALNLHLKIMEKEIEKIEEEHTEKESSDPSDSNE